MENTYRLKPKTTVGAIAQELNDWAKNGVEGHFSAVHQCFSYHKFLSSPMSKVVGSKPAEVVVMNSHTVNLHFLMVENKFALVMIGGVNN